MYPLAKTISECLKILNKIWPDIRALTLGMCKFWMVVHLQLILTSAALEISTEPANFCKLGKTLDSFANI